MMRARVRWPPARREFYHKMSDYNCGDITAEQLLVTTGSSLMCQSEAHNLIAQNCLGLGDRAGAMRHFQACLDTRLYSWGDYVWAGILLARLKADPQYPRWVKHKT